jgi:hypothetical protein
VVILLLAMAVARIICKQTKNTTQTVKADMSLRLSIKKQVTGQFMCTT